MTTAEALALIRDSNPYKTAGGKLADAWPLWASNNPREASNLDAIIADPMNAGAFVTKFGRGWMGLVASGDGALPPSQPAPVVRKLLKGAICVVAANMNVDLLREAGITHVAVELTHENGIDFGTSRWQGFTKGWYVVSRGNDGDTLANAVRLANVANPDVTFTVVDVEAHKTDIGGSLAWTETLNAAFRSKLGAAHDLYNITFGLHSSPAVVNHVAWRRWNVTPIFEAYDDAGKTLGVGRTTEKAELEGWPRPHVALGDKSLVTDVLDLKAGESRAVGGVWLYGADMGPAQDALGAGIASALKGIG